MNTYEMIVTATVRVECFEEADAVDLTEEAFGEGDYGAYEVTSMRISGIKEV